MEQNSRNLFKTYVSAEQTFREPVFPGYYKHTNISAYLRQALLEMITFRLNGLDFSFSNLHS